VYFIPFIALVTCRDLKSFDADYDEASRFGFSKRSFIRPSKWLSERKTEKPLLLKTSGGQSFRGHILVRKSASSVFLPKPLYNKINESHSRYKLADRSCDSYLRFKKLFFYENEVTSDDFEKFIRENGSQHRVVTEKDEQDLQPYVEAVDDSWCLKYDDSDIMKSWKGFSTTKTEIESQFDSRKHDLDINPSKKRKIEDDDPASRTIILNPIDLLSCELVGFLLRRAYEEVFGHLSKNAIHLVSLKEDDVSTAFVQLSNQNFVNIFLKASNKIKFDG
jgi:hypothetical protein